MERFALWLSVLAVAAVFGACSAVLALMGVGVPFVLAALGVSVVAGGGLYLVLQARALRQREAPLEACPPEPPADDRDQVLAVQLNAATASLRHDLRGALSPALLMADRLTTNPDPAVQRAGEVVVRSIDRATALIARRDPAG